MTAQADLLYLPILSPVRRDVGTKYLAHDHSARQSWRERVYRAPAQARPSETVAYGPNGGLAIAPITGKIIDIFA